MQPSEPWLAHGLSVCCAASLLFIQIVLTGWVESKRLMDFQKPGTQDNWLGEGGQFKPMDNGYPGGAFFDPFGLSRGSEAQLRKYQVGGRPTRSHALHMPASSAALHIWAPCKRAWITAYTRFWDCLLQKRVPALEVLQLVCIPAVCCNV